MKTKKRNAARAERKEKDSNDFSREKNRIAYLVIGLAICVVLLLSMHNSEKNMAGKAIEEQPLAVADEVQNEVSVPEAPVIDSESGKRSASTSPGSLFIGKVSQEVIDEISRNGVARVIVTANDPAPDGSAALASEGISAQQDRVLSNLKLGKIGDSAIADVDFELKSRFSTSPSFAGVLTASGLAKLENDENVRRIYKDEIYHISLDKSVPLINGTAVWAKKIGGINITGIGETICVLDTGINYSHPDLGGCSNASFLSGSCSKVPGGFDFVNFDLDPMDDEGHGTHVAGIIASENAIYRGVAPGAKLIALKV